MIGYIKMNKVMTVEELINELTKYPKYLDIKLIVENTEYMEDIIISEDNEKGIHYITIEVNNT